MPDGNLQLLSDGPIATLNLCNPKKHNALGARDVDTFCEHLAQIAQNTELRVLIITNPEGKTFCAGAALNELASGELTSNMFARLPDQIAAMRIPTIAAINGNAFGGGSEIALSCDFRMGIPHMKLHVPPARIGLCYPVSGIERFVHKLGVCTAKRLLVAHEEFHGDALYEVGFLTHLIEKRNIAKASLALAKKIAGLAPLAVSAMKQICDDIASGNFDRQAALQLEAQCNRSEDLKEGVAAVLANRTPSFQGR